MKRDVQADFERDIVAHQMTVKLDQGLYRHLLFKAPGSSNHWFEIVTYPWKLVISGDMGTWVFSREEDMFEFFRGDRVNIGYWAEKVQNGVSGCSKEAKVYDADTYKSRIYQRLNDCGLTKRQRQSIIRELNDLDWEDEHQVQRDLYEFDHDGFQFTDLWETDTTVYSYHYQWCCHAIVWAIKQYDAKEAPNARP